MTNSTILFAFIISLAVIIFTVVKLKLHPFLSLIIGSILMGILSKMELTSIMENICSGFGGTMRDIGILILLGVILGELLHVSGSTRNIAEMFLKALGIENTPLAINLTGFLICIPVFFDAAFVILIGLVKQLSKEGKIPLNYLVCALSVGLTMTHAMVIPTPGPLAVAGTVGANIGWFIFYSIIVALPASLLAGVVYGKYLGTKKPAWGDALDEDDVIPKPAAKSSVPETKETASGQMGTFLILLPIILIIAGTMAKMTVDEHSSVYGLIDFLSNTNIILLFTVFLAFILLRRYITISFNDVVSNAAESVGSILAIICAGGGFGTVISASGLGDFMVGGLQTMGIPVVVLAFVLCQTLRMGLGSITVSLVTTSAVLAPIIAQTGVSPILAGLAICAGGIGLCMPNDSSFWTISKFSNFSFAETFRTLTISGTIAGFSSFALILVLSMFANVLPGLH